MQSLNFVVATLIVARYQVANRSALDISRSEDVSRCSVFGASLISDYELSCMLLPALLALAEVLADETEERLTVAVLWAARK